MVFGGTLLRKSATLSSSAVLWGRYRDFNEVAAHLPSPEGRNPIVAALKQPGTGTYLSPGLPLVSNGRPVVARPAPVLGPDTYSILTDRLGLQGDELFELQCSGIFSTE